MCMACEYETALDTMERCLVNSAYAPHAIELLTLIAGIKERQHVGEALWYRFKAIEHAVTTGVQA